MVPNFLGHSVCLRDIIHSATLHGVGVITKQHFAILRYLRNQLPLVSLRGHSRSSILVPIESAYTYIHTKIYNAQHSQAYVARIRGAGSR